MRLLAIILPGLLGLTGATAISACAADTYVVADAPPADQAETATARPGMLWVHGHWAREGHRWDWKPGFFTAERPGQIYIEGRWERRGNQYIWVTGNWRTRDRVVTRDAPAAPAVGQINP